MIRKLAAVALLLVVVYVMLVALERDRVDSVLNRMVQR